MSTQLFIPLELAELLHATLGPLADVLEGDGHNWARLLRTVEAKYEERRDLSLAEAYGDVRQQAYEDLAQAVEQVELLTAEDDFDRWRNE